MKTCKSAIWNDKKPKARKIRNLSYSETNSSYRVKLKRSTSLPILAEETLAVNGFGDPGPRSLRLAEVKSWSRTWRTGRTMDDSSHQSGSSSTADTQIEELAVDMINFMKLEDSATPGSKRPQLTLKLEHMPTPMQAEKRAERAAIRSIARTEGDTKMESFEEGGLSSPEERTSTSEWSPGHGRFTTKDVSISEAGISSTKSPGLHIQCQLATVKELGRGACGVVYKAVHVPTLTVVAVKEVQVYGKGQRSQMVRELHALYANLVPMSEKNHHENKEIEESRLKQYIVNFYDAYVQKTRGCVCLVMQYMGAGSLQDVVLSGGCQDEVILARIAKCILEALVHIHGNRMVHRDIKPHNLLLNRSGYVKISDFGLARTMPTDTQQTKTFVGTLLYMAPERIGGGDYSYSADIWSFGLSFISVALGQYPLPTQDGFFGLVDSVADTNEEYLQLPKDQFSESCQNFVDSCLCIDPELRGTAETLLKHPFIVQHEDKQFAPAWRKFVGQSRVYQDPKSEVEEIAEAVYAHIYGSTIQGNVKSQMHFGTVLTSKFQRSLSNVPVEIPTIEKSLQMGLARRLELSEEVVFAAFEQKRLAYMSKLLEQQCLSPQSWSASPGVARRHQLLGSESENDEAIPKPQKHSLLRRLQNRVKKFHFSRRQ